MSANKSFADNDLDRGTHNNSTIDVYHPKEIFTVHKTEDFTKPNRLIETPRVKLTKWLVDKNIRW